MAKSSSTAKQKRTASNVLIARGLLILSTLALVLIGLLMVYSASFVQAIENDVDGTYYVLRQGIAALIGFGLLLLLVYVFRIEWWDSDLTYVAAIVVGVVLLLTAAYGFASGGAQRWISIGGVNFQPSEFAKITLVLTFSKLLCDWWDGKRPHLHILLLALGLLVLPIALILVFQSDLGTTAICMVGIIAVAWVGGVNRAIIVVAGVCAVCIGVAAIVFSSYRGARLVFLNPWNDGQNGQGDGYQLIHSLYGFAEGGLFGVGLGSGAEKYLYLTQAESDFIFSVVGEELGMVGAVAVVLLYMIFLYAGLTIAMQAPTPFARMVAGGLTVMLVFQAFVNMGCAVGILPTTGKPLPFISHGGSSIMSSLAIVGFLWSISRSIEKPSPHDKKRESFVLISDKDSTANKRDRFRVYNTKKH